MDILISIAFIFIVLAIILLFGVGGSDLINLLNSFEHNNKKSLKKILENKENKITKFISNSQSMLEATGQKNKFTFMLMLSVVLVILSVSIIFTLKNLFLLPVFVIAFGAIPFIYIKIQYVAYNKLVSQELNSALSVITSSYERNENILMSFKENLNDIAEPVKSVFESFVVEVEKINPNYDSAIDNMKSKINNNVWIEWCEALKRCSRDRTLKYVLAPVVLKLSKIEEINSKLENILMTATRDFYILTAGAVLLVYVGIFVIPSSLMITIPTNLANGIIAVNLAYGVYSIIKVVFITKNTKFDI